MKKQQLFLFTLTALLITGCGGDSAGVNMQALASMVNTAESNITALYDKTSSDAAKSSQQFLTHGGMVLSNTTNFLIVKDTVTGAASNLFIGTKKDLGNGQIQYLVNDGISNFWVVQYANGMVYKY